MKQKLSIFLLYLIIVSIILPVALPSKAEASVTGIIEYRPGESATVFVQLLTAAGTPVNAGTVLATLTDSDGNDEWTDQPMSYMAGSDGIYSYDFTAPYDDGEYVLTARSTAPVVTYGSTEIYVNTDESQNWSFFIGFIILITGMMIAGYVMRRTPLIVVAAGGWLIFGIFNYTQYQNGGQVWDLNYSSFFFSLGMMFMCVFEIIMMRESKEQEEEDKEYDDPDFPAIKQRADKIREFRENISGTRSGRPSIRRKNQWNQRMNQEHKRLKD